MQDYLKGFFVLGSSEVILVLIKMSMLIAIEIEIAFLENPKDRTVDYFFGA